jgi:hypothetical protein
MGTIAGQRSCALREMLIIACKLSAYNINDAALENDDVVSHFKNGVEQQKCKHNTVASVVFGLRVSKKQSGALSL